MRERFQRDANNSYPRYLGVRAKVPAPEVDRVIGNSEKVDAHTYRGFDQACAWSPAIHPSPLASYAMNRATQFCPRLEIVHISEI